MTEERPDRALERRVDLVDEVDRVEDKLQRTRLTPWVWATATVWFLIMGFYTGNWPPAGFLASITGLLAASSYGIRRGRRRRLRDLQDEMEALSGDGPGPRDPDRPHEGPGQAGDTDAGEAS